MQRYESRLVLPLIGFEDIQFFTRSGTLLTKGYVRVEIGGRGPYIEFRRDQIVDANIHVPESCRYRIDSPAVYYEEARSNDASNVKLYIQKKTVDYADYRIGMVYISPFDLTSNKYPMLVKPLEKKRSKPLF